MLSEMAGLESEWARQTRRVPQDGAFHWMADKIMLDTLGLGTEQAYEFLGRMPDFDTLRQWIVATAGPPDPERLDRHHAG